MWRCVCTWCLSFSLGACDHQLVAHSAHATKQVPEASPMQELADCISDPMPQSSTVSLLMDIFDDSTSVVLVIIVFLGLMLTSRPTGRKARSRSDQPSREHVVLHEREASSAARSKVQMKNKTRLSEKLNRHAIRGDLQEMVQTLEEIEKRFPSIPDMTDYHRVIVHVARGGDPSAAHKWLRRSQEVGLRPTPATFTTVIRSYVKAMAYQRAKEVANEMASAGLEFDTVTYNAMIHACLCEGDALRAQRWMKTMLASGAEPNEVSVATVMLACASVGLLKELDWWFAFSQKLGFQLKAKTFDSILGDFQRRGDEVNAMKWLTHMIEHGLEPEINSFHRVLSTIINVGDAPLAGDLIQLMCVARGQPSNCILSRCIVMAANEGQRVQARRWADDCVAGQGRLTQQARHALCQAGLRIPRIDYRNRTTSLSMPAGAESKVDSTNACPNDNLTAR